jgi:hypothetical protein
MASPLLYRAMRDDRGLPALGRSGRALGVRLGFDVEPDLGGRLGPDSGGLSVAIDDPVPLPGHRRPPECAAGTARDPLWVLDATALGPELAYRPLPAAPELFGRIEPACRLTVGEFEHALAATRASWRRVVVITRDRRPW